MVHNSVITQDSKVLLDMRGTTFQQGQVGMITQDSTVLLAMRGTTFQQGQVGIITQDSTVILQFSVLCTIFETFIQF